MYRILQPLICFIYRTLQTGCQREDADVQIARDDFSNATVPTLAHVSTKSSQFILIYVTMKEWFDDLQY